jgi:hypothetical protein
MGALPVRTAPPMRERAAVAPIPASSLRRGVRPPVRNRQTWRDGPRNRRNPSMYEAMAVDPNLHVMPASRERQVRDADSPQRRHIRPIVRFVCRLLIAVTVIVKRALPFKVQSERALNWLGPRFLLHWCSPDALEFIVRHFTIETNLINFVARNCGAADVAEVGLRPTRADDLGEHVDVDGSRLNAVARHDANIFNLIIDLGESPAADVHTARPLHRLDFSMLTIPEVDVEPGARRWLNLDVESALHITVLTLAVLMDVHTAERAANSFQLDESLLASIANLTGDPVFRTWTPIKFGNWFGWTNDIGRDLHWHMIVNEYAHTRLQWMAAARTGLRGPNADTGLRGPNAQTGVRP